MADGSTILDLFQMTDGKFEYLDPVDREKIYFIQQLYTGCS